MNQSSREFTLPNGTSLRIERVPDTGAALLPWSAADEYLIRSIRSYLGAPPDEDPAAATTGVEAPGGTEATSESSTPESAGNTPPEKSSPKPIDLAVDPEAGRPLVLGDSFGLLTVALAQAGHRPIHVSDSVLEQRAARANLDRNGLDDSTVTFIDLAESPEAVDEPISLVVMKISKSVPRLKYEIGWVRTLLTERTKIVAAGMTKHLSPNTKKILEEHFGPTQPGRVHKKAIGFFVTPKHFGLNEKLVSSVSYSVEVGLETDAVLESFPGVFSQDRLDVGTRLLLESLPDIPDGATIVDLGCGNGVIALLLKLRNPSTLVHGVDDSYLAVSSAELNFETNDVEAESLQVADGLENFAPASTDWVVSNPPFHSATSLTMEEAARHFRPAAKVLKPGGKLIVVGTHGLDYGPVLRSIFGTVRVIGKNKRFRAFQCEGARVVRRDRFDQKGKDPKAPEAGE